MPTQNKTQLSANARYFMKTVPEVWDFSFDEVIIVTVFATAPNNTTTAVVALTTSIRSSKSEVVSTTSGVV